MDDPELKIQTFRPTWEEFKDFKKYIEFIESQGAHKAGLARIIPPPEFVPRRQGYNDLTKLKIIIKKPICQAVANVSNRPGAYQQVNVPLKSMTVTDFRDLANSELYRPPPHSNYRELEELYWNRITSHAAIYGADVNGTISDKEYKFWNINSLNTILDFVGKDYDMSIDGVNTAYLYFGMWKTTFGWHTEDMDLYSINYLHFGAPKSWYSIPPAYGRKFEKLCAALFPNSYKSCRAFLRHKMTVINPKWLDDYSIPYDRVTQEPGHIMITFPFGYHAGFNHGFNCAESTNFATERWIDYGKHAILCHCCPDSVKFPMDCFVKRFQPTTFDTWKSGQDNSQHPEYRVNPIENNDTPASAGSRQMSFIERNPDLDLQDLLENPYLPQEIKDQLRHSYLVTAEDEMAEMEADYDERMASRRVDVYNSDDSAEDIEEANKNKGKRKKKCDSDYDDDWYEKTGNKFVSADGKHVKKTRVTSGKGRGRPRKNTVIDAESGVTVKTITPKLEKPKTKTIKPLEVKSSDDLKSGPAIQYTPYELSKAKVSVVGSKDKTVTVMSGKPSELPLPQQKPAATSFSAAPKGPSYNDAFAQFLQQVNKAPMPPSKQNKAPPQTAAIVQPKESPPPPSLQPSQEPSQQVSVIQASPPKSNRGRKKKNESSLPFQITTTNSQPNQLNSSQENQRVKTERIPQTTQQMYAIQENTVLTQDGKSQKLYYTILNPPSTNNCNNLQQQQQVKMNSQYALYGQQQQQQSF